MTLMRYLGIVEGAGLRLDYMRTNLGGGLIRVAFRALRRIPFLREYFTVNVYSVARAG
jgi:hypothetical protein